MKFTPAIFFVIATICFFDIGRAVNYAGTDALTRLKATTSLGTSFLKIYRRRLIYNLNSVLAARKYMGLAIVNGIVNSTLTDVRTSVESAKAMGKNAEQCYEPARLALTQASDNDAQKNLEECSDIGSSSVDAVVSNIDATRLLGNRITNDLHAIEIDCQTSDPVAYQNCIVNKIPDASLIVRAYEKTAIELKKNGDSVSSSALVAAASCNRSATHKVRQAAIEVRQTATNCVANS